MNWLEFFFPTPPAKPPRLPKLRFALANGIVYVTDEQGYSSPVAYYSLSKTPWFGRLIEKLQVPEEVRSL